MLVQDEREKIDKELAKKIKKVKDNYDERGLYKTGMRYTEEIKVNLNAFEKFIRFRVESDLKNFPIQKTEVVYEKIYERAIGGSKVEYPFGIRGIIEEIKRNDKDTRLLKHFQKVIKEKIDYVSSIVTREIAKDKERERFKRSFEKDNYKMLKTIASTLDEINILFNEKYVGKKGLFVFWEYKLWFEINKPCVTMIDFKNSMDLLSRLINGLNKENLKKIVGEIKDNLGSIYQLEKLLKDNFPNKDSKNIISCFRRILTIRNNLLHKKTKDIIKALKELNLNYPITDYQFAFNVIITDFFNQIDNLHNILSIK